MSSKDGQVQDIIKIIVIGDAKVGKSSFIDRFVNDRYTGKSELTLGFDFVAKHIYEHGGRRVCLKLQFWDIAGQERYALLTRSFFMFARGCIVLFDLTNSDSFENVRKWKRSVDSFINDDGCSDIPCLLVANKLDLSPRGVTHTQIEQMCQDQMFTQWTETSVKDGTNVNEAVNYLLDVILGKSPKMYAPSEYEFVDHVVLSEQESIRKRKTCKICD
jgi:Ras-related protein Rab-7L1